jgi:hypothetical protein
MKPIYGLLALGAFGLAACAQSGSTGGTGDVMAAGDAGPGYCEGAPPADPAEAARWNDLCFPDGR